jgi:hypothetical protein
MRSTILLLLFTLLYPHSSAAALAVEVRNEKAVISFPESVTFSAELSAATEIESVRLIYGSTQQTCGQVEAIAIPEFTPGKKVQPVWTWDMRRSGGEPPGADLWWQWEVTDADGRVTRTPLQHTTWLDKQYNWKVTEEGLVRLHTYAGGSDFAKTLRQAAVAALSRLAKDTGIKPDAPIDLYIYASLSDLRDAVLYEPGWTGGLAFPEYHLVIIGIDTDSLEWGKSTVAHELTHVLVGDYTFTCLGDMPTWLVEGLAVYGEGGLDAQAEAAFDQNVRKNTLLTFQTLSGGFSEDPNKADLSYSQSYKIVDYLVSKYGKQKLLSFLSALKSGDELNDALISVYQVDLNTLENNFRTELGLPAGETAAQVAAATPTIIPTIQPISGFLPAATLIPVGQNSIITSPTAETFNPTIVPAEWLKSPELKTALWVAAVCACALVVIVIILVLVIFRKRRKANINDQGGAL